MANIKKFLIAVLALAALICGQPANAVGHKVVFSNQSPELELGASVTLTLRLDQPIICDPSVTCQVAIDFTGSTPTGITIAPTQVVWQSSEWSQERTIEVALAADATDLQGQTITVTGQLTTNSSYYAPETPSFTVNVPAAIDPPVAYSVGTQLGNTGSNDFAPIILGSGLIALGTTVRLFARKRVRK